MSTTTTNGQKPVYNGVGFEEPKMPEDRVENNASSKWLIPLFYIAGILLFAFFMYWIYQEGVKSGEEKAIKEQNEILEREINAITAEKKQNGITEREKSKSSAERAQIIRNGIIRDLPMIKDTTREYKHKYLKELAR